MSKKTNKTSHVMDLLTNGASAETDAPVAESPSGQEKKAADVQTHTATPAKVTVVDEGSRNDRLSQEILGKLTEELEEETRQELQAQEDGPDVPEPEADGSGTGEDAKAPDGEVREPAAEAPEAISRTSESDSQASEDALEPVLAEEEEKPQAAPASDDKPENTPAAKPEHPIIPESQLNNRFQDKEYRFVNVMEQLLMRQNLDAVLPQYGVCTCPRCMSDVCALALTGLPAKYVVTSKHSISPLISYYENKYKIPVLTELMKACNKVRENPRHKV